MPWWALGCGLHSNSGANQMDHYEPIHNEIRGGYQIVFSAMPETFVLSEVTNLYADLNIKKRTVNRYVQQLMNEGQLECLSYAVYRKVPPKN
jgi:hypothetical protein